MLTVASTTVLLCSLGVTTAVTFNWSNIQSKPGEMETIADFSQLQISSFTDDDETINYVNGPITFTKEMDESYKVYYSLQQKNEQSQNFEAIPGIPEKTDTFCNYIEQFFRSYMRPMTRYHNDFPPRGKEVCPLEAGTYNILPVQSRSQLSAQSGLSPGEYKMEFIYQKDGKDIGSLSGRFVSKDG